MGSNKILVVDDERDMRIFVSTVVETLGFEPVAAENGTEALEKAGKADPKAVAFALEGMEHETFYGKVTMRAEDHQLIQPLYISTMTKAGTQGVKYDVDNTGMGWKTNFRVEAEDTAMPTTCKMERPKK